MDEAHYLYTTRDKVRVEFSESHQKIEASRTLVPLDRGATGGSASIRLDSTAPPKQNSMELNQHANGLLRDSSRAPARHDSNGPAIRMIMYSF